MPIHRINFEFCFIIIVQLRRITKTQKLVPRVLGKTVHTFLHSVQGCSAVSLPSSLKYAAHGRRAHAWQVARDVD